MPFVRLQGPPGEEPEVSRFVVLKPSADPRASKAYKAEKVKAKERDKLRDQPGLESLPFVPEFLRGERGRALMEAVGEPIKIGDEVRGGMAVAGNEVANLGRKAFGKPTVDSRAIYLANKDAENERRAARERKFPVTSGVGSVLGGMAAAPVKAKAAAAVADKSAAEKALGFGKNVAKASAGGGIFASLYGAADGEGMERLEKARDNFLPGAALGGSLYVAGSVAAPLIKAAPKVAADVGRAVTRKPPPPGVRPKASPRQAEQAAQAVERIAQRRALTPEAVRQMADETFQGKPVTAAELLGRDGVTQLAATARRPGATADELEILLRERQRAAPDRVIQDFADDLGVSPETARGDIEAIVAKGRKEAGPLYDAAYAADAPQIPDDLMRRVAGTDAIARAQRIAKLEGRNPYEMGLTEEMLPGVGFAGQPRTVRRRGAKGFSMESLDYIKRGLDDALSSYRDRTTGRLRLDDEGRAVRGVLNDFRGTLIDGNKAYGQALDTSSDYLSMESALDRGRGLLTRGSVREFGKVWAGARGAGEREALKAALSNDVLELAQRGLLKGGKFSVPGIQQKLELAFGREGTQRFLQKMEAEAALARTGSRMMPGGGSPTYELAEAGAAQNSALDDLARIGGKAVSGQHGNALLDGVRTGFSRIASYARTQGMPVEVRDEFGRLLQMSADEFEQFLRTRQPAAVRVQGGDWYTPALTGGQVVGAAN